jgi:hypothetical protein
MKRYNSSLQHACEVTMESQLSHSSSRDLPDYQALQNEGWTLQLIAGDYCVGWKGSHEAVFQWQDGIWRRLTGLSSERAA